MKTPPFVERAADGKGVVLTVVHACGHTSAHYYRNETVARQELPIRSSTPCRACKAHPQEPDLFQEPT